MHKTHRNPPQSKQPQVKNILNTHNQSKPSNHQQSPGKQIHTSKRTPNPTRTAKAPTIPNLNEQQNKSKPTTLQVPTGNNINQQPYPRNTQTHQTVCAPIQALYHTQARKSPKFPTFSHHTNKGSNPQFNNHNDKPKRDHSKQTNPHPKQTHTAIPKPNNSNHKLSPQQHTN